MADSMENIVINESGQVTFNRPTAEVVTESQVDNLETTEEEVVTEEVDTENVEGQDEEPGYYTAEEVRQLGLNLDPKRLPPELITFYKSMQADYTRKSQEMAEKRRAFEQQQYEFEMKQRQQQAPQQQQPSMKEYYNQLNAMAINDAENALGEKLLLVDEYGNPNFVHQAAYNDAIANIKIKLYEQQQQQEGTKRIERSVQETIARHQSDPDWNEISQFAVKMMKQMPFEAATELQERFRNGDVVTLDKYLRVVKEEFEKQKYPARKTPTKPQPVTPPSAVQSANTVANTTKAPLDVKNLGYMPVTEQTNFIKQFLSSK